MRKTLATVKLQLIKMRHVLLGDVGRWLGRVARGWMNYFAIPGNMRRLIRTIFPVRRLSTLIRKSVFSTDLRQELYGVILHVRICAGDDQHWPFLPRPLCPLPLRSPLGLDTLFQPKPRVRFATQGHIQRLRRLEITSPNRGRMPKHGCEETSIVYLMLGTDSDSLEHARTNNRVVPFRIN